MWKPRFKFSLRTLLICTTLVAIYLCVAQAHRKNLLRVAKELEAEGVTVEIKDGWIDTLWMRRPTKATIKIQWQRDGTAAYAGKSYTSGGVDERISGMAIKLRGTGFSKVQVLHVAPSESIRIELMKSETAHELSPTRLHWGPATP
jgi:hypothetical protein